MERIALIIGENVIYWRPLLMIAAVITSACFFVAFYTQKGGSAFCAALTVPLALVLSVTLSRFVHWYCRFDNYESFRSAMTDYSTGGYALVGVFAGCFITALILRLLLISRDLFAMLDSMCIAGSAGIAIGRLSSFFDSTDRGPILENIRTLPWVYPVTNPVSGVQENRLAIFLIQAIIAGVLFLILLVFFLVPRKKKRLPGGDVTLLFLLIYGASQAILDSLRYDSLFFRSNGFISMVQVFSAVIVVFVAIIFSVRIVKKRGMRLWYFALWSVIAGALGLAGYMEYYIQRHGSEAAFGYTVMTCSLAIVVLIVLVIRLLCPLPHAEHTASRNGKFLNTNTAVRKKYSDENPSDSDDLDWIAILMGE